MSRLAITVDELAALLPLNVGTIYDAINDGEIPTVVIGRRKLIPMSWVRQAFGVEALP